MHVLLTWIVVVGNVLLAGAAYAKKPKSVTYRLFFLFACTNSIFAIVLYLLLAKGSQDGLFLFNLLLAIGVVIFPLLFLLTHAFPHNHVKLSRLTLANIILFTIVNQFLAFSPYVVSGITIIQSTLVPVWGPWSSILGFNIGGFLLLTLWTIIRKKREMKGAEKIQLTYFSFGLSVSFLYVITISILLWFNGSPVLAYLLPSASLFFIGITAYALMVQRFSEIKVIIANVATYAFLILFLSGFYLGELFLISLILTVSNLSVSPAIPETLATIAAIFLFQPVKKFLKSIADRIFYRNVYESEELLARLSHIMASTAFLSYLAELLLQELHTQMKVSFASLVLIRKSSIRWIKNAGDTAFVDYNEEKIASLILEAAHKSRENMFVYDEMVESSEKTIMKEHNLGIVLPLVVKDDVIGAILMSDKTSGDIYSPKDIEVLKILAPQAAVAVNNALSYEEIKRFNITLEEQVKRSTDELRSANTRLEQLDHVKDEFVSLASHELRTPMTVIKSYLWLILQKKGGELTPKQQMYLDRAYNSTQRLINLVNDMLNVSRIESGRLTLTIQEVDIFALIEKVHAEMQQKAQELGLSFELEKGEQIPYVAADPERVEQVLINLIGNSLKFTPRGGRITISLRVIEDKVAIHITDTGKGIKAEDKPRLFQKFGMLDTDSLKAHYVQSSGLGLYLSKSLVELQGGEIWVDSEGVGKGSTFGFSIPVYAQHTQSQSEYTT